MDLKPNDILSSEFTTDRFRETTGKRNELGQEEFLRLMITQIQNQDPFEPLQNGEFIAQMAQFGTVSGIGELNDSLNNLAAGLTMSQSLSSASLIGKSVLTQSSEIHLQQSADTQDLYVDAGGFQGAANLVINDASGNVVGELDINLEQQGINRIEWNGLDRTGEPVEPGLYRFSASLQVGDEAFRLDTYARQEVRSINIGASADGDVLLELDSGESIQLRNVEQIFE